ncbi:MAG TPA: U32 family peptidase, partial [Candidatus Accumulibacter sp.]|nr:U32 family peptidase [Accumulibacter sp.]
PDQEQHQHDAELREMQRRFDFTDGFYQRHHEHEMQNYLRGHSESGRSLYVGDVIDWHPGRQLALIDVKNRISVGDRLEIIHPSGNRLVALEHMESLDGAVIRVAPGNGHRVWIPLPAELPGAMLARFV